MCEVEGMHASLVRLLTAKGKEIGPSGRVRERGLRCKLAILVGRDPKDYADAKAEARRGIVAWKDGRDARELLSIDAPTLTAVLGSYDERRAARRSPSTGERRSSRRQSTAGRSASGEPRK